jgi:prepilin-type N-terminal cleavage/methylation domain-containing protein
MILNKKNNYSGFSLIELSIVLIIMGLLVAGITGGASLIKTAQLRSVVTEAETYRTAFNTYYSQAGDVPGVSSPGTISNSTTAWTSLKSANVVGVTASAIAGVTDTDSYGVLSKFRGAAWFWGRVTSSTSYSSSKGVFTIVTGTAALLTDFVGSNVLYVSGNVAATTGVFVNADAKNIDDKIDDGNATTGYVRGLINAYNGGNLADYTGTNNYSLIIKLDF